MSNTGGRHHTLQLPYPPPWLGGGDPAAAPGLAPAPPPPAPPPPAPPRPAAAPRPVGHIPAPPAGGVYLGAVDGVRALAVVAVILFHAEVAWMQGGFIGVDLFFVISGYLIGAQLWTRSAHVGQIGFERFYQARARRLLPTLGVVLAACAVATAVIDPAGLAEFRANLLASLTFTTNWWFVAHEVPYFEAFGRPSSLQHLWSLAVEEQFYLVLPIVFVVLLGAARTVRARRAATMALVGALAALSAAWMAYGTHAANVPFDADGSRFYFGTDSHAFGLLLGVLLAVWRDGDGIALPAHLRGRHRPRPAGKWLGLVGVAGLAFLGWVAVRSSELTEGLYVWQLQGVAVASVAVVAAASRRNGFSALLEWAPLRAVGRRSYGLYLWHWPVMVFTRPGVDVALEGWPLVALQVAATFVLAELTFRLVEEPVRTLGWGGYRRRLAALREGGVSAGRLGAAVGVAALLGALVLPSVLPHGAAGSSPRSMSSAQPVPQVPQPPAATTLDTAALQVSAYGDSVMRGATPSLVATFPTLVANTEEGAQASVIMDRVQAGAAAGALAPVVVLHMGTNGLVEQAKLERTLRLLSDRDRVVLVTVHADRPWVDDVNQVLREVAGMFGNVRLADWAGYAAAHPEVLYEDGIHVQPPFADAYTQVVAEALERP